MYVIKRDGRKETVHFDKITARISKLAYGLHPEFCDPVRPPPAHQLCLRQVAGCAVLMTTIAQVMVAQKVTAGVYRGVTTSELDELAAETAAAMTSTHPDYALVCNCGTVGPCLWLGT